eukprot:TRINITY_DN1385_c0_g2_i1.p1 TRINITY_DN1385_c0_g2~~TRINITY_DN1385_c0_g2_i1.p1  ORF type:complete len:1219 (+),score=421.99 TRINITY_DN1385_c0_g2_i1:60-3716(+)
MADQPGYTDDQQADGQYGDQQYEEGGYDEAAYGAEGYDEQGYDEQGYDEGQYDGDQAQQGQYGEQHSDPGAEWEGGQGEGAGAADLPDSMAGEAQMVLDTINTQFNLKVQDYLRDRMAEVTAEGYSEQEAHDRLLSELDKLEYLYQLWRVILTEDKYQKTEREMLEAQEGAELFEWFTSFGGGVIPEYQRNVLLCSFFPGSWNGGPQKYLELLDWVQREYSHVPEMEFFFLKNKIHETKQGQAPEHSHIESDEENERAALKGKRGGGGGGAPPSLQQPRAMNYKIDKPQAKELTGHTKWLHENARIARMYERWSPDKNPFSTFFVEIGISPGFRVYLTLWLVGAALSCFFAGFHSLWSMLDHLFIPYEKTAVLRQSGTLLTCISAFYFFGLYFTAIQRVIIGWVFLDDETFYGDQDFSVVYNEKRVRESGDKGVKLVSNPVSKTNCAHLLPPCRTNTFLMLPAGKKSFITRKVWMAILVWATVIIPFFYAVIAAAIQKENLYSAVGYFVHWNWNCANALVFAYFCYQWYYALRKKYRAWKVCSNHDGRWREDAGILYEFALDERSARRNLLTLLVTVIPIFAYFWYVAYDKRHYGGTWLAIVVIALFFLVAWREMWRVDSLADKIPISIVVLMGVYMFVGIAGSASDGERSLITFLCLMLLTQAFSVRHRPVANVDENAWLLAFLRKVDAQYREKQSVAQTPKTPGMLQLSIKHTFHKIHDEHVRFSESIDPNTEGSWFPCAKILRTMFGCVKACFTDKNGELCCVSAKDRKKKARDEEDYDYNLPPPLPTLDRGHWRLSGRYWGDHAVPGGAETVPMYDPEDKLALSANPKFMLWYGVLFFIACIFTNQILGNMYVKESKIDTAAIQDFGTAPWRGAANTTYPACRMKWGNERYSTVDLAWMQHLGMKDVGYAQPFYRVFNGTSMTLAPGYDAAPLDKALAKAFPDDLLLVSGRCSRQDIKNCSWVDGTVDSGAHPFTHFFSQAGNHSYFVLRYLESGRYRGGRVKKRVNRDVEIWGASVTYQVFSMMFPFARFLSEDLIEASVMAFDTVRRWLQPDTREELDEMAFLPNYVAKWKKNGNITFFDVNSKENVTIPFSPRMTVLGHGTTGGVAKIVAARLGVASLTFNAPGTRYIQDRYSMREVNTALNIIPVKDLAAVTDKQTGAVQHIRCDKDSQSACHHFETTFCELLASCGDVSGRWLKSCARVAANGTTAAAE